MYIIYNENKYPCKCSPSSTMVYSGLPDNFPSPVEGIITLCANDGFVMRTDVVEDYLRQTFENGVLTLTNEPEPEPYEPPEEPEKPTGDYVTWDELATAYTEGVNSIG